MTYNTLIFSISIFALCSWLLQRIRFCFALSLLVVLLCNLPLILSLSITQWLDSLCGSPSLFLALLSLGSLLSLPKAPLALYFFPSSTPLRLNIKSKIFIFCLCFILFWGNINYLWGFDPFNAGFYTQILIALAVVILGYFIQPYLGVLLLLSCVGYLIKGGNIFSFMCDALVWLYALLSLLLAPFVRKDRAK